MKMQLSDSDLKVMNILWTYGDMKAKQISDICKSEIGWNINTTYTVIKTCIKKGAIKRQEPDFICIVLVGKEQIQAEKTSELIKQYFNNSTDKLFSALIDKKKLSPQQIEKLKKLVSDLE